MFYGLFFRIKFRVFFYEVLIFLDKIQIKACLAFQYTVNAR